MKKNHITNSTTPDLESSQTLISLRKSITRLTSGGDLPVTAIPNLSIFKSKVPTKLTSALYEPSICLSVQGAKRVLLGEDTFVYDVRHFLITSVHLPTVVQVIEASREKPFLALRLMLDRREMAQLILDGNLPPPRAQEPSRGMESGKVSEVLLAGFQRLVDLLSEPQAIPVVAPLVQKEIIFRLLLSEQGTRLREIASIGTQGQQVSRAIDWLKNNFNQPLRVNDLAAQVHMSATTFHTHFRTLTAMSPLQFQKRLRLTEARRLMLAERIDASTAALQVGYESPSQFSREYTRMYGVPPSRDIKNLREVATRSTVA